MRMKLEQPLAMPWLHSHSKCWTSCSKVCRHTHTHTYRSHWE